MQHQTQPQCLDTLAASSWADGLTPQPDHEALLEKAERLWPDSISNRKRWYKAVAMVRTTRNGWLLDKAVGRRQEIIQ